MTNKRTSETIIDYGLYKIIIEGYGESKHMYIVVGYSFGAVQIKININRFWHDIAQWKAAT